MNRIPSARALLLVAVLATLVAVVPVPSVALGPPATLAAERLLGSIAGPADLEDPTFPIGYLAVSWTDGSRPAVRFRTGSRWTAWTRVEEDEIPTSGGRTWSALVPAESADAYQVRGQAEGVRAVAINTTDGPRALEVDWPEPEAEASHLGQPPLVSRQGWGANENLRFEGGSEKGTRTFYPTQKLIVHHTVTANDDPDPAATVRAIYYYHTVTRDYLDIAYNFLIDAQGTIYKGRYSGPQDTKYEDTLTGENAAGKGVTGAHTGGYNSGTVGIAILGDYSSTPIPLAARQSLVAHLAWEAERHGLDPLATTTYVNPAGGGSKTNPNISGHRDWTSTACPGQALYDVLPEIRQEVLARTGAIAADTKPPRISGVEATRLRRRTATIRWRTQEPATSRVVYWKEGSRRRRTPLDRDMTKGHSLRLRGLARGTEYRFEVVSRDAAKNESESRPHRFRTRP